MVNIPTEVRIRHIVKRFCVRYEVHSESTLLREHSIRPVGFCLELYGRDGLSLSPGDERSREIYEGLYEIALQIVPPEDSACRYALDEFSPALHYGNKAKDQPEVELDIHILHKIGFERPIDADEARALQDLEDRLKELGIGRQRAS